MERTIPNLIVAALRLQNLLQNTDLPVRKTKIAHDRDMAGAKSGLIDKTSIYVPPSNYRFLSGASSFIYSSVT